jgi:phospholipid-binding lipoprotein MlaA
MGPSNPRDLTGNLVDYVLDPLTWVGYAYNVSYINTTRTGLETLDTRARNLEAIEELRKGSVDFYATVRSLYRQRRNDAIKNGEESEEWSQSQRAPIATQQLSLRAAEEMGAGDR